MSITLRVPIAFFSRRASINSTRSTGSDVTLLDLFDFAALAMSATFSDSAKPTAVIETGRPKLACPKPELIHVFGLGTRVLIRLADFFEAPLSGGNVKAARTKAPTKPRNSNFLIRKLPLIDYRLT
jgi:hypothetical protein